MIVIEDADRLNDTSGNLLLKAIEEPPPRTVWLLVRPSPDDVLVTIRSRCRHVGLRVPPVEDVAALLVRRHGVDPAVAAFAARAATATSGLARRLATDEGARIRRREVLRLPGADQQRGGRGAGRGPARRGRRRGGQGGDRRAGRRGAGRRCCTRSGAEGAATLPPPVRAQVKQLEENQKRRATRAQRDVLDRSLLDLLSLYRDVLVVQLGAEVDLVNAECRLTSCAAWPALPTPEETVRRMDAIGLARERIGANVSPLLAVEALMVSATCRPSVRGFA